MVYQTTSERMRGETASPSFNIEQYLESRDQNPHFVMVEVGHGSIPVAYQQPEGFTGKRAYIGLEAWLRSPKQDGYVYLQKKIGKKALDQNIFYMSYDVGGEIRREPRFDMPDDTWYLGPFETQSLLPDQTANEVYASNVFCDPHISYHRGRTETLLGEMTRILDDNGVIILHETITPTFVSEIDQEMLDGLGLKLLAIEEQVSKNPLWDTLQDRYDGSHEFIRNLAHPNSFYLFLGKNTED